jgi:hypothetical protein
MPSAPSGPVQLLFTDVLSGPVIGGPDGLGVPIALYGKGFGSSRGSSKVTIGGVEVAAHPVWGEVNAHNPDVDMIVVQPGSSVIGGPVIVTVGGNTFDENGRQGISIGAGVTGVRISGNTIVQSDNTVCLNDCTWYRRGHIEIAGGAEVEVRGNTYRPAPPVLLGTSDLERLIEALALTEATGRQVSRGLVGSRYTARSNFAQVQ